MCQIPLPLAGNLHGGVALTEVRDSLDQYNESRTKLVYAQLYYGIASSNNKEQ